MRRLSEFVRARHRARLAGRTLTYEQFERDAAARCRVARAAGSLHTLSGYYYRRAGLAASEGARAKAAGFLAVSAALNPAYAIPRVWDQVVSAKVKRVFRRDRAAGVGCAEAHYDGATPGRCAEAHPTSSTSTAPGGRESCCPS